VRNGCGQTYGRLLHDKVRCAAVGARWEPRTSVPSLKETIAWARRIPRAARAAQGFTRLVNFARYVKQLRAKRAKLREWHPEPVRRDILDKLECILNERKDLIITARRRARFTWKPRMYVWWGGGVAKVHDGVRLAGGTYYDKRNVAVPAAWLLARLGSGGNVATRMRRAVRKQQEKARKERQRKAAIERKERQRKAAIERATAPSPEAPDTLGWRGWHLKDDLLISPVQATPWHEVTLHAEQWSHSAAVRGVAGIHARRLPRDWRRADPGATEIGRCDIHGIVERFGRYVLGSEGWRAEWVVIRELLAPNAHTALALMRRYPELKVHVREREASDEDR
jgi:hypothetical protein